MTKLQRTTFEISRAAEYFDARQLSALVGVSQDEFASVCLKELVDNSLDACETAGVSPVVGVKVEREDDLIRLSVSDNGPGIPAEVVRKVLDYNIRVSDKAAYRSPTRGAQGNALKTVIGIPYALGSRGRSSSRRKVPAIASSRGSTRRARCTSTTPPRRCSWRQAAPPCPSRCRAAAWWTKITTLRRTSTPFTGCARLPLSTPTRRSLTRLRATVQKTPKFTNRPMRGQSRSTCRASRQVRIGTVSNLLRCWSSAT